MNPGRTINPARATRRRRRGISIVEVMIGLTIFGLAMLAVTRQLIEGASLTLKSSRLLEYARTTRSLIGDLNQHVRTAQVVTLYAGFDDRTKQAAGSYGNYLVLHDVASDGTTTRTIGYYVVANGSTGTYALYRHDSADGVIAAGSLPDTSTSGTHRKLVATFKLPTSPSEVCLFRNWNDRGVSVRGQFGAAAGQATSTLNLVQCTLTSRS